MPVNITSIKTSSNGILEGDNPLYTAFPLLIVQMTLILVISRLLAFAFKPLRQPKVIAEIVGGILLGPSALGRNHTYLNNVFPKWSMPILESVASIGLLFFLFLVGLELDFSTIRRSSRQALSIAVVGISLPFGTGAALAILLRRTIDGADKAGYVPFVVFMGVALSITAFPVLARILAELKLLTTHVGQTAMAVAAFDDVTAWILLALAVALAGNGVAGGSHNSPLISVWVLLCGIGFVALMFICVKPIMAWVARRCSSEQDAMNELYITITLGGALVLNDAMFAILVLMALFTTFMTTPIVMAIYKPDKRDIRSPKRKLQSNRFQIEPTSGSSPNTRDEFKMLACAHGPGNVPGLINLIESTRSTVEKSKLKLYIMHLIELTERTSSIIMVQRLRRNGLPFIDPARRRSRVEVYDKVSSAFETYAQLGKVMVRPVTVISSLTTMHEDVCHVAEDKMVMMVILPFHKMWRKNEESGVMEVENAGHGWRGVNQRVLKDAPCSVAVFLDRGFDKIQGQRICVVFFGGPDDREALELGGRMADHPDIQVTVIRFLETETTEANNVTLTPSHEKNSEHHYTFSVAAVNRVEEKTLDDAMVEAFRKKWGGTVQYTEQNVNNIEEEVLELGKSGNYELVIVGKGRFPSAMVSQLADRQAEHAELGPIGDILSSSHSGVVSSLLVVQQHDLAHVEEMPVSKVGHSENEDLGSSHLTLNGFQSYNLTSSRLLVPICYSSSSNIVNSTSRSQGRVKRRVRDGPRAGPERAGERHCPETAYEKLNCLVPVPIGYQNPFRWPKSRDMAWYSNVPFKRLVVDKEKQNWVRLEGDRFVFPGGGTSFRKGVKGYIDVIKKVATFGAALFDYNILTVSIAPLDTHEAQVQFALERGVPAMLGILSTYRLPFPSRSFDLAHCARCLVNWTSNDGLYLLEVDRVLRPGGYWVLSGPPISWKISFKGWERSASDLEKEQTDLENLANRLCWKKVAEKGPIAVWQKPTNHVHCAQKLKKMKSLNFCRENDPDSAWYKKMESCISPLPDVRNVKDTSGGILEKWPKRLNVLPSRFPNSMTGAFSSGIFNEDNRLWKRRVHHYGGVLTSLFDGGYRNIMDMNAGLGGFASAISTYPVWVMNVVPFDSENNTLGVIYERGLIGTYMNWCEAFSTYPRTYDLIHADGIFSLYMKKCDALDILLEMYRILRPHGAVIVRDHVDVIFKVRDIMENMGWKSILSHSEHGPFHPQKVLFVDNTQFT
ncbi:hypothetical protein KSS87_016583 [Heliosperma pusillum]|nr:hypothetical protein KSS87_016583 [Heliosperma pusillum]